MNGTPLALWSVEIESNRLSRVAEAIMSDSHSVHGNTNRSEGADGRRRKLRALLLSAADAARQGRRTPDSAGRVARPMGRAVRDRISMLLSAAG